MCAAPSCGSCLAVNNKEKHFFCKISLVLFCEFNVFRSITVYTADGEVIATYSGKIDIDTNDGGYVKFDLDGKRYIYYNCFVESIADID